MESFHKSSSDVFFKSFHTCLGRLGRLGLNWPGWVCGSSLLRRAAVAWFGELGKFENMCFWVFVCFCDTGTLFSNAVSVQGYPQVSFGLTSRFLWPPWGRFRSFGVPGVSPSTFFGSLWRLWEGSGFPWSLLWNPFGVTLGSL